LRFIVKNIGLFVLLNLCMTQSQAQFTADFSADTLTGCAPRVVAFTNLSSPAGATYEWYLGVNTNPIAIANPSAIYFNPGSYTVKLIARWPGGQVDSMVKTSYIRVFAPPDVNFSASDTAGCYPLRVNFQNLSAAVSGNITKYEWDFGDGTVSGDKDPFHIYTFQGNFSVTLKVTTSEGCTFSIVKTQYIKVSPGVTADFFAPISSACKPPVSLNFTNFSTGPGALTYQWNFGNGQTSTVKDPVGTFNTAGDYTVTLVATSNAGCRDTIRKPVNIPAGTITSSFDAPDTICIRQSVQFKNTSVPDPDSTFWSFGDGGTSLAYDPVKSYSTPGVYNVRLRNKFGTCIDTIVKPIVVVDTPKAVFTNSVAASCKPPFTVRFFDQSTGGPLTYFWDFGDGTSSTDRNPVKIYGSFGKFTVKLTVTNRNGCKSTITKAGLVNIARPVFSLRNLPDSGCVPFVLNPIIDVVAVDTVQSYFWDFGNGTTSTSPTPSVTYNTPGNYTIKLRVTTKGGCTDSVVVRGIKAGLQGVAAAFSATPLAACAGESILFSDLSTGNPTGWLWEFGDGTVDQTKDPIHSYSDTGKFTITLTAYNQGCPSTVVKTDYISIKGAIARFGYQIDCSNKRTMQFLDSSINAATWFWDFGDGTTSTVKSPLHTFPNEGEYNVSLTVTNDGCTFTKEMKILIVNEKAEYTINPGVVCRGSVATFTARQSVPDYAVGRYQWDFGNGVYVDSPRVSNFSYAGMANGTYTTRLKITDYNGCLDSTSQTITIGGPTATFGPDVTSGCKGLTVNFTDSSYGDGTVSIINRIWDFGDGTIINTTNTSIQHVYTKPGTFNVKLKVIDAAGCVDSMVKRSLITTTEPKASFTTVNTETCPGRPVQFNNTSSINVNNFFWSFGDGNTSTLRSPAHIYTQVGLYTVKLRIRDRFGCEDSMIRVNYVNVDTPNASFTVSDSVGNCPPLQVEFKFTGKHAVKFFWDFGDGGTSELPEPEHFYSIPGVFTAKLIVTSPGGCTDTAFKTITVFGPNGTLSYSPSTGCTPLTVNFSVTTQNVAFIYYQFGDGELVKTTATTQSYTYTNPGFYPPSVLFEDSKGCKVPVLGKDTILVVSINPGFKTDAQLLCDRGLVQFTDTSKSNGIINSWLWDFGDGQTSTAQNPLHQYNGPGNYNVTLTVRTSNGCTESISKTSFIKIVGSPVTDITASADSICINNRITFNGVLVQPDTSAIAWSWNFANGQTSNEQNPPSQLYSQAGNFTVQLITTNSSGCKDTVLHPVYIQPLPTTNAGLDTAICLGQSIQLNATGANSYVWSPSTFLSCTTCPNPTASPIDTMMYYVTGSTTFGCTTRDSVMVTVIGPSKVVAPADDSLCAGQSIQLIASGTAFYSWSPATGLSNPNIANPTARPETTTTYVVTGSDRKGCFVTTDEVTISVFPFPVVDAGRDTTIQVGFFTQLNATFSSDVQSILWSPSVGLSCTTCPKPVAAPTFNTTYSVTVTNNGGCQSTDAVTIYVVCNDGNIFMPNTFSPNGDGMNEIYYPRGRGINTIRSLRIFNRWGQLVFEKKNFNANDPSAGWDGTFKGTKLSPDVYVYMMDLSCENSSIITMKGDITLIR
jgi:gliding motility-associated-like protein